MNIEKLNPWLTLATNLGVLAGIIFLGMELRQNSEITRAESRNTMTEAIAERLTQGIENSEFADVLNRGLKDEELTEVEKVQFRRSYSAFMWVWSNLNFQYRSGLYDEDEYQLQLRVIQDGMHTNPGLKRFWCENKIMASTPLIADIEAGEAPVNCAD